MYRCMYVDTWGGSIYPLSDSIFVHFRLVYIYVDVYMQKIDF